MPLPILILNKSKKKQHFNSDIFVCMHYNLHIFIDFMAKNKGICSAFDIK